MKSFPFFVTFLLLTLATIALGHASDMCQTVKKATAILEARQESDNRISFAGLCNAKGVAIIEMTRAGLVVGGTRGEGIVVLRMPRWAKEGRWSAPIPIRITGASLGAQIGKSKTRAIILLNTDRAVRIFTTNNKVVWSAAASRTSGADTATRQRMSALSSQDITVYRDTHGYYRGATLGGSTIHFQKNKLCDAYGRDVDLQDVRIGRVAPQDYCKRLIWLLEGDPHFAKRPRN